MCINSVAPNTAVGRGFAECRIVIPEGRSCLSTRRNDSVPVVGGRPVPQNVQVAVPDVYGSTGALLGKGQQRAANSASVRLSGGSPGTVAGARRRTTNEHRPFTKPNGGVVRHRKNRFDRIAAIDRGVRSDGSGSAGSGSRRG